MYLSTFDVSGIQQYIFGSNALKDNIGASMLVSRATGAWLKEAVAKVLECAWSNPSPQEFFSGNEQALLVLAAGGNAQVAFKQETHAKALVGELSGRVLRDAPGLRLLGVATAWPDGQSYGQAHAVASARLEELKGRGAGAVPLPVFSVVERCAVTGAAASRRLSSTGGRVQWVSRPVAAARETGARPDNPFDDLGREMQARASEARRKFDELSLEWTNQLDLIRGRKGEKSYLGVIHIDANGMGKVFRSITEGPGAPREVLGKLRETSDRVDRAVRESVLSGIEWLLGGIKAGKDDATKLYLFDTVGLHRTESGKFAFPLRPIVVAGDDTTLVVEASVAIDLAARITAALAEGLSGIDGASGACAGVALGKAHSPFWRLYELAERSCHRAKVQASAQPGTSYVDWEFLEETGLKREMLRTMRPYELGSGKGSWARFRQDVLSTFHQLARQNRGQVKALATDLASGRNEAVQRRLDRWAGREVGAADPAGGRPEGLVDRLKTFTSNNYGTNAFFDTRREGSALVDGISLLDFSLEWPEKPAAESERSS